MELNKRKKNLLIKYIVIGVLCLALGFGSGYLVFHNSDASAEDKTNMTVVDEVVELLNNNWLDTTDSKTSIQDRMIAGLVDGLGVSHSSYLSYLQHSHHYYERLNNRSQIQELNIIHL